MVAKESFLYPVFDIMFPVLAGCVVAAWLTFVPVEQGIGPPPVSFATHVASHSKLATPLAVHPIGDLVLLEFFFAFLGGLLDPIDVNGVKLLYLLFARLFFSRGGFDILIW